MDEEEVERIRRLLRGSEPGGLPEYLMRPLLGRVYLGGTGVIDPGQFRLATRAGRAEDAELPDHFALIGLSEYMAASASRIFGSQEPPGGWKRVCLRQHPPRELLANLVALNRIRTMPNQVTSLEEWYVRQLPGLAGQAYRAVKADSSIPRQFLARQAILLGMREVILSTEKATDSPEMPPLAAAIMLTHAIADELDIEDQAGPEAWKDMPAAVLMEIVQNSDFNRTDDLVMKLDRHWRTWKDAGSTITVPALRAPLDQMVIESLNISLEDLLMFGLILDSGVMSWRPPRQPVAVRRPFPPEGGFDQRVATIFLDYVSRTEEQLKPDLAAQTSHWGFLPFESAPVVRLEAEDYVVLDQEFLQDRIMRAVYWAVHDHEKRASEKARASFAAGFGQIVEHVATQDLMRLAPDPASIPGAPAKTFYDESAIVAAYSAGGRKQGKKNADAAIWTPTTWLVVEIVNGMLQVPTRQGGDLESFRADTERLVIDKLEQLESTSLDLLRSPAALAGVPNAPGMMIQPILVQGGQFPVHPATIAFVEELMRSRNLLRHTKRLAIIEASELDLLEAEIEDGKLLVPLLDGWLTSERRALSLKNYLVSRRRPSAPDDHRPGRLKGHTRLREILNQLPGDRLQAS